MKFHRTPLAKPKNFKLERSPQRMAAARRVVQRDKDSVPLFPELVKHKTAEERVDANEVHRRDWQSEERNRRADAWRKARRMLRELPAITRQGLLRYWNGPASLPRDPSYLADAMWGINHRGENPWTAMREARQVKLAGEGRLSKEIFQRWNFRGVFKPYCQIRIRKRIERRTSIRGTALYTIRIP